MRKNKSIAIITLIFITIVFLFSSYSFAGSITEDADSFLQAGSANPQSSGTAAMKSGINDIASILTGIGIITSVVVGAILGIQFITGSIEQQAKVKESIIPYVCGCVVIFGALIIWKLIIELLNNAI